MNSIMDRPDDKNEEMRNAKQVGENNSTGLDNLTKDGLEAVEQQDNVLSSYLTQDSVLVILMASSIVDKDTTIKSLQKDHGFKLLGQHTLQLSSSQVDILYAYDVNGTKPHYRELYEGWKKSSLSDPVQVLVLEKEKAVDSFQALVNNQNSTKKKNRMMDPQSVYASIDQDNVKRDIELLLGTSESNNLGVSSADDTVVQAPLETMDGSMQNTISMDEESVPLVQEIDSGNNSSNMVKSTPDNKQLPVLSTVMSTTAPTMVTATFDIPHTQPSAKETNPDLEVSSNSEKQTDADDIPGGLNKTEDQDSAEKMESSPPIVEGTDIVGKSITKSPSPSPSPTTDSKNTVEHSIESEASAEEATPTIIPAGDDKAGKQQDSSDQQKPRDILQTNKKKQTNGATIKPATRKAPTSDIKTDKTAPQPPLKSKLRVPTKTTTARPAATPKTPIKQQVVTSTEKTTEGTKKTAPRVPRVALLAPKPTAPVKKDEEPQKRKPATTMSKGAIARLSAPTASSARRQQGTSPAAVPSTKGTSVTATFRLEQRKLRSSSTAPTAAAGTKQPGTRLARSLATKKTGPTNDTTEKKREMTPMAVKKGSVTKKQESITQPPAKITTTSPTEKAVEETAIPSPATDNKADDKDVDKAEPSPRSPAESSTTSSRPQTPEQSLQERPEETKPSLEAPAKTQKPPVAANTVKNLLTRFM